MGWIIAGILALVILIGIGYFLMWVWSLTFRG